MQANSMQVHVGKMHRLVECINASSIGLRRLMYSKLFSKYAHAEKTLSVKLHTCIQDAHSFPTAAFSIKPQFLNAASNVSTV